ncbi:MAG: hypothetical protein JOZ81_31505 [Chloroflexi bacterium]|nr:hypothetical protein [Chloroflexota bacterium]MBV9545105.1 hypothetical protein [Chloroflexota bacterium]
MPTATLFRASCLWFVVLGLAGATWDIADAQGPRKVEAFVGPFPSWRQVHCTGQDDTALLQDRLNTLGRSGSKVLYIQPGTCRITSTLHLGHGAGGQVGVKYITLLGHDPADTKIVWGGPSGTDQHMLEADGVAFSRFGRSTWDGAGCASNVVYELHGGELIAETMFYQGVCRTACLTV